MHRMAAPSTALSKGSPLLLNQLSPNHSNYIGDIHLWGLGRESCNPSCRKGSSFPGLVPSGDMVDSESVVGIKPANSGVVIGY